MTWLNGEPTRKLREFDGPRRKLTVRIVPGRSGDPVPLDAEWVWPDECRQGPLEQAIVEGTHRDGEVPCFGCPLRPACDGRLDDQYRTAAEVMGKGLADLVRGGGEYRKCPGCEGAMTEWTVKLDAWARVWHCVGRTRKYREIDENGGTREAGVPCNHSHAEPAKGPKLGAGNLRGAEE